MNDPQKVKLIWPLAGFLVVIAFGVGVIATAAYDSTNPFADAVPAAASGAAQVVEVELGDLYVKPTSIQLEPGDAVLRIHNAGKTEHNLAIGSLGKSKMLAPDESADLSLSDLKPGKYEFICEVAGHADGGMKGTLTVSGEGGSTDGDAGHEGMGGMSPEEMVEHDAAVTGSFPAETRGKGGQILEPEIADDGTKVFKLTASVIEWETEPGNFQEAWAYNGQVPGPTLKADLGDRVRIELTNKLPEATTLHLHGLILPPDMDGVPVISQDAVMPGQSFSHEFVVRNSGTNMYHSHFNAQKQVPLGLLGGFIVADPKDPDVDVDYSMVVNDGPLGFTINGKGFPATEPIVADHGQTVRIRYMNEGMQMHPMHLHGMPQTVIAIDGHLLKEPYKADTIPVAPGQRVDVLVEATEKGTWAFHCHILNHAEGPEGMFGMVTAMVVQ